MAPTKELSSRNRSFLRRRQTEERQVKHRTLQAAATPLDLTDKTEARKLRVLRQGWQQDAANYVDATPELSFAYRFLAHSSSRMRYYPALVNPEEPDGPPIPAQDVEGVPQGLLDCMNQAMASLGVGRMALAPMQESMSYQFGVPGECFLVGQQETGEDLWKIRSIEEFMVYDDQYKLREVPLDPQGTLGWTDLDPATTYAARMWVPHWRFSKMATSPMRSLLDVSEELLMLSRDVRSTARSRLAGGGIMKIPEGLRMESFLEDDEFAESEDWYGRFAEAMMTPLSDEGVASAVVPIGISGDPEALAQLDHLVIDRPYSALAIELRQEAIGRMATGLDVPREVLEGISDPNHWGGWLVSDDTFRHHVEPQVIKQVDAMTIAFFRAWLRAAGIPDYWVRRACIWYDPVDLITKPDPMANAVLMHDRFVISDAALREAGGANEADAPEILEVYRRQLSHLRTFPPNVLEAIIHAVDPNIIIPPINASGQIPGMGKEGAVEPPPPPVGAPSAPSALPPAGQGPPATSGPTPAETGPPAAATAVPLPTVHTTPIEAMAAEAATAPPPVEPYAKRQIPPEYARLSRKLAAIDAQLRARIQTAANAAMMRQLDTAGAKLRTKITDRRFKDAEVKAAIQGVPNRHLAEKLGPALVASVGFATTGSLIKTDWAELRGQFTTWVEDAQEQALRVAAQLAKVSPDDPRLATARRRLEQSIDPAWDNFKAELDERAEYLLFNPANAGKDTIVVDANTVVPVGLVRRALAIAGGKPVAALTAAAGMTTLDYSGAAEYLGVPEGTVRRLARERAIAHLRIANRMMFDTSDLDAFLEASRVETFASDDEPGQTAVIDPYQTEDVTTPIEQIDNPEGAMASVELPPVDGQIGTGDAISEALDSAVDAMGYEWVHGGSGRPFEPHEELDGTNFTEFDSEDLANGNDWPENDYYFPGDHDGCSCDFTTMWGPPAEPDAPDLTAAPDETEDPFGGMSGRDFSHDRTAQDEAIDRWSQIGGHLDATDDDKALLEQALRDRGREAGEPLYRGTTLDDMPRVRSSFNVPLASGSPDINAALAYAENGAIDGGTPVIFEYPTYTRALDISDRAAIPGEQEHLLGGNFKVLSIEKDDEGIAHITLDLSGKSWSISDHLSELYSTPARAAVASTESLISDTGSNFLSDTMRDLLSSDSASASDLRAARDEVMPEIRQAGDAANAELERLGGRTIQTPGGDTGGEYDWYKQLSTSEKDRLRNNGYTSSADASLNRADQMVAGFIDATGNADATVDDAMQYWLEQTRIADASQLLQSTGRMPANLERFGGFSWDNLTTTNVDVSQLFAAKTDAMAYVQGTQANAAYELAERELTASTGPSIYQMTYQDYSAEVERLGSQIENAVPVSSDAEFGETYSAADQAALSRYDELLPEALAPADQSIDTYSVWLQAQQIAKLAGLHGEEAA